jgi:hypothetical protein
MSQENVEVVRQIPWDVDMVPVFADPELLEATRRVLEPILHPGFEVVADPTAVPMGDFGSASTPGIATGIDGFIRFWREWLSAWESWVTDQLEFIEVDENRVLVIGEIRARSKTHQVEMSLAAGNLITLRDGLVMRMELFMDRAEALEAAGLSE